MVTRALVDVPCFLKPLFTLGMWGVKAPVRDAGSEERCGTTEQGQQGSCRRDEDPEC